MKPMTKTENDESFEIIDVIDGARYLDEWSGPEGRLVGNELSTRLSAASVLSPSGF